MQGLTPRGNRRQAALNSLQEQAIETFELIVNDTVPRIFQGNQAGTADSLMLQPCQIAGDHDILVPVENDGGDMDAGEVGPPVLIPQGQCGPDGADTRGGQGQILEPIFRGLGLRAGKQLLVGKIMSQLGSVEA